MKVFKYILALFVLVGCQQTNKDKLIDAKEIIDIPKAIKIDIEDFVEDFDTIRLEASHQSLLSSIREICVINNKLYITDNTNAFVFIYSLKGKYINKICDQGEGPNEYIKIGSIGVNPHTKQLFLTDNFSGKIFEYNEDASLKHIIKLDFLPYFFTSDSNGEYIHLNSGPHIIDFKDSEINEYNVTYINKQGEITQHLLKDETPNRIDITAGSSSCNYASNGDLLYMPMLSNTIYRINNKGYSAEYAFRPTEQELISPQDKEEIFLQYKTNGLHTNLTDFEKEDFLISCGSFRKSDSLMIVNFGYDNTSRLFFSINNNKAFTIKPRKFTGNKGLCEIFSNSPRTIIGNTVYIAVDPMQISYALPLLPEGKLKTFFESFTEDDNPCIIAYRINKKLFDVEK